MPGVVAPNLQNCQPSYSNPGTPSSSFAKQSVYGGPNNSSGNCLPSSNNTWSASYSQPRAVDTGRHQEQSGRSSSLSASEIRSVKVEMIMVGDSRLVGRYFDAVQRCTITLALVRKFNPSKY